MIKLAARAGRHARWALAAVVAAVALASCVSSDPPDQTEVAVGGALGRYVVPAGIHKIKHVIIVMQENRSFDNVRTGPR